MYFRPILDKTRVASFGRMYISVPVPEKTQVALFGRMHFRVSVPGKRELLQMVMRQGCDPIPLPPRREARGKFLDPGTGKRKSRYQDK